MTSEQYAKSLLQAMLVIAQQSVKSANFDKTIQGTIVRLVDPTIGKYKIKYQDGYWFAYSNSVDVVYSEGSSVYILIPNGDMNNEKTIIGSVNKLGINYVNLLEQSKAYADSGANTITDNIVHSLCSYNNNTVLLYDYTDLQSVLSVNQSATATYLKTSSHFILSSKIKTNLPLEQRYGGNYGIRFYLDFLDNATNNIVTRIYTLDIDKIQGNPYSLSTETNQQAVFLIDNENFVRINKIDIFNENFPIQDSSINIDDIFISDISILPVIMLSSQEKQGISLNLIAKQGYIFTEEDNNDKQRTIEAQIRVKMKPVDLSSQVLDFYWFIENNNITPDSIYYNKYGGQGWKCLNEYYTIQNASLDGNEVIQFVPSTNLFSIKKSSVLTQYTKYKCVVKYGDLTFSKDFIIINEDYDYRIIIDSNQGTNFSYDYGNPTLKCSVFNKTVEQDANNFTFVWSKIDNSGTFTSLPETTENNILYNNAVTSYNSFKNRLDNEQIYKNSYYNGNKTNQQHLQELKQIVQNFSEISRIQTNYYYNVPIKEITNFNMFKCSVYDRNSNTLIGTGSITLNNSLNSAIDYMLVINNGTQVFNYTEAGVAPTNSSLQNPYAIPALSFNLYDEKGNIVANSATNLCKVEWFVPASNTMLDIPNTYIGHLDENENKIVYQNYSTLAYDILKDYVISNTQNTIKLKVTYKNRVFYANTNLSFIKQGLIGTNGTDYQVKIVPYVSSGDIPEYPVVTIYNNIVETNWNHDGNGQGHWFNVEFWHNGLKIFDSNVSGVTSEGNNLNITWSILANKYTSSVKDDTCFSINSETGSISVINTDLQSLTPCNVIKATVRHAGLNYYATFPVVVVERLRAAATSYTATLKPNSGFNYVVYKNDGTNPLYDNHKPFEIEVTKRLQNNKSASRR